MKLIIRNINKYTDEFYIEQYKKLNIFQKEKINKLVFENDKKLSILGMYLVTDILGIEIDQLFYKDRIPYVNQDKFISITHKFPYVAVVVSSNSVGIDMEIVREISDVVIKYLKCKESKNALIKWTRFESLYKSQNKENPKYTTIILNNKVIITICEGLK